MWTPLRGWRLGRPGRKQGAAWALLWVVLAVYPSAPALGSGDEEEEDLTVTSVTTSVPEETAAEKSAAARETGFAFLTGISTFVGTDDNVYRSPAGMTRESAIWGSWAYLQGQRRWPRGHTLAADVTWIRTQHPRFGNANLSYGNAGVVYERRLGGGFRAWVDLGLSRKNDDATTIYGREYRRDYSYYRYAGDTTLRWRLSSHHRFTIVAGLVRKDYGETAGMNSIDWNAWEAQGEYRLRFAPYHYLTFRGSTGERSYREEPAADERGVEGPDDPAELHRYRSANLTYTLPAVRGVLLEAEVGLEGKKDLYQDYESNQTRLWRIAGSFSPSSRLESRLEVSRSSRRYEKMEGDAGHKLRYTRQAVAVGARYMVVHPAWIFGKVELYARDTNRSTGSSYRDYRGTATALGMSVFY